MTRCSPECKVYSNSIAFTGSLEAAQDSTIHTQPCSNRRCGIFVQNGLFSHPAVFYPRAINLAYKGLTLQTFTQNRSRTPNWTSKVRYWRQKQRSQARARTKYILDEGKHRDFFFLKVVTTKKSPSGWKDEVEFAMQEGFQIDSFYLDSGLLLTCIYFLITQSCVINLSLDSACHTNEWIRILSINNQPVEVRRSLLRWLTWLILCVAVSSLCLYFLCWGVNQKEIPIFLVRIV